MKRQLYSSLIEWKNSSDRMPLMLYGARQVGKTYLLKKFGENEFENMLYFNCYADDDLKRLFSGDKDVRRILRGLSSIKGEKIHPEKTLIILDEAQEIPQVIASLKYFYEDAPSYCIAVAGSLLGVLNLKDVSFPTGKVNILHLYPMTFPEFLMAMGEDGLLELMNTGEFETINALSSRLQELLRQYYFVGGMPHAVREYVETGDLQAVRKIQNNILDAYQADIAKHAGNDALKSRMVFQAVPSQLAKENSRFVFGALRHGARASQYEEAIQWLEDAGLIYKICNLSKVAMPISFYMERTKFKLYLLDVGLLGAMSKTPAASVLIGDNIFKEYKGAFTENYVLTQLVTLSDSALGYFSKERSSLEIDFILQYGETLYPIEVKAEENVKAKSLRQFITIDNRGSSLHGYRISMKGFAKQDWMTNIPLYAVLPFLTYENNYNQI